MNLTPHATLRKWLLEALRERGGSLSKQEALRHMERTHGSRLTDDDRLPQPSNQETKWENRTAWERRRLVEEGLLEPYHAGAAQRGQWTLTAAGWIAAEPLH
ncbi:winged helix-turn-helix domain-containing protein [Uniformispora flossi]|uniref:winged helix-turn-helix domain-containing protein n=1 Tax=Uniformispora flossi TaxID=3390723 RepID=UPI003C2E15B4